LKKYDLIVIGGGITGAGIARDASMRGFKTLLIERKDFASGATGACMGMIGGPVGVPKELDFTRMNCSENAILRRIAKSLMHIVPFLTPVFSESEAENQNKFFEIYYEIAKEYGEKKPMFIRREQALEIEPRLNKEIVGAFYHEEWSIDVFRLTIANVISASEHGADILNYNEVIKILRDGERVIGVRVRDVLTGVEKEFFGDVIVNATGAWAPKLAELAGVSLKMRPTKGVILILDRRISNVGIQTMGMDLTFKEIVPHENTTLIGPTNDDYFGDIDNIPITETDVELIITGLERVFPAIRQMRYIRAMAGLRPLLFHWGVPAAKVSRRFEIIDHSKDGAEGFISVVGGNMTIYRLMAEKTVDYISELFGKETECKAHVELLPTEPAPENIQKLADKYKVSAVTVKNLVMRHGRKAIDILDLTIEDPSLKNTICVCEPVIEAEIRYVIKHEWVRTIDDIRRRTRLGMGPCQGTFCTYKAAGILMEELNLDAESAQKQMKEFIQERWKGKRPILRSLQLPEEEIAQAFYIGYTDIREDCENDS